MKKSIFLKTVTVASMLAVMTPLTANAAAKLESNTSGQMNVGDIVDVKITTEVPVEMMQFDLNFDKTKFTYEGMETELDQKGSNLIEDKGIVRVSTYDETGDKTKAVTLKFKAQSAGDAGVFSINNGRTIELGEGADTDTFDTNAMKVASITITGQEGEKETIEYDYIDENGEKVKSLPRTGKITSLGKFSKLGNLEDVLPYALNDSDASVTFKDIKDEYGNELMTTLDDNTVMKTGDTVRIATTDYKIIVYGDINKDGKVSTQDILMTYKNKTTLDDEQKEAADIQNDEQVNDSDIRAMHDFILEREGFIIDNPNRTTIIDKNPEKLIEESDITFKPCVKAKNYTNSIVEVATVTAKNGVTLTKDIVSAKSDIPEGAEVIIEIKNNVATISVKTTATGQYKVTPIVVGSNVKNGEIAGTEISFGVDLNQAITNIKFYKEDGTAITDNKVTMESLASEKVKMEFYYEEYDIATKSFVERKFTDALKVGKNITDGNNVLKNTTNLYDNADTLVNDYAEAQVKELLIQSNNNTTNGSKTANIEIIVKNESYGVKDYSKPLTVIVNKTTIKSGLKINGNNPVDGGNINSYAESGTINGGQYKILPITFGDGSPIPVENLIIEESADKIKDIQGNIIIYDDSDYTCWSNIIKLHVTESSGQKIYDMADGTNTCNAIGVKEGTKSNIMIKYYDEGGNPITVTYVTTPLPARGPQGGTLQRTSRFTRNNSTCISSTCSTTSSYNT